MKLRCQVTGNPCGTDTWPVGEPCICLNCLTTERDDLLDLLSEALPDTTPATGLHEEIAQTLFSLRGTQCLLKLFRWQCLHSRFGDCVVSEFNHRLQSRSIGEAVR